MSKTMCQADNGKKAERLQKGIRYECKKCDEKAYKEKHLCKPKEV